MAWIARIASFDAHTKKKPGPKPGLVPLGNEISAQKGIQFCFLRIFM